MRIKIGRRKVFDNNDIGFLESFLPLYSVLIYYRLPVVGSIGQLILLFFVLVYFILRRTIVYKIPKWLLYFTLYVIPVQIIVFYFVGGFNFSRLVNLLMIIVYLVILSCFKININGLLKVYKIIALIASILIIVQFIQINFRGQIVHQIMILPVERSEEWYSAGVRPQGLFPEPQVFATFILPILVLVLQKAQYIWAVFFSISIVFSTSSLGILCVIGIWCYYIVSSKMNYQKKIAILIGIVIGLIVILKLPIFEYAIEKIVTTDFSNNVRLTRGFIIFEKIPAMNKIFGIGVNNLEYFINSKQLVLNDLLTRGMRNPSYITSAYELLVNYGLIATFLYCIMLYKFFRYSEYRLIVILLAVLSFGQTILFSGVWCLYMFIIVSSVRNENDCFIRKKKDVLKYVE